MMENNNDVVLYLLELKKMIVAIAGPWTNILIIIIKYSRWIYEQHKNKTDKRQV